MLKMPTELREGSTLITMIVSVLPARPASSERLSRPITRSVKRVLRLAAWMFTAGRAVGCVPLSAFTGTAVGRGRGLVEESMIKLMTLLTPMTPTIATTITPHVHHDHDVNGMMRWPRESCCRRRTRSRALPRLVEANGLSSRDSVGLYQCV